jgi:hypothetical protein
MEQPPSSVALWVQWQTPGMAADADHLATVMLRQATQLDTGRTRPGVIFAAIGFLGTVMTLAAWPAGIVFPIGFALLAGWRFLGAPRQVARRLRGLPTAHEPCTVTLDAEGLHVVGPSVADHLRWKLFEAASLDEDVLVLRRRGLKHVDVIPMATLDPGVDRDRLVAEVERAIAASAPPA